MKCSCLWPDLGSFTLMMQSTTILLESACDSRGTQSVVHSRCADHLPLSLSRLFSRLVPRVKSWRRWFASLKRFFHSSLQHSHSHSRARDAERRRVRDKRGEREAETDIESVRVHCCRRITPNESLETSSFPSLRLIDKRIDDRPLSLSLSLRTSPVLSREKRGENDCCGHVARGVMLRSEFSVSHTHSLSLCSTGTGISD